MSTRLIYIAAVLAIFLPSHLWAALSLVPSRNITVLDGTAPTWQKQWVKARLLVRDEKYQAAEQLYSQLAVKPYVPRQLLWEYGQLLFFTGSQDQGTKIVESLLDESPDSTVYLLFLAKIDLRAGRYQRAYQRFEQVYRQDSFTGSGLVALKGMVKALLAEKKGKEALPYMRQIIARDEGDADVLKDLVNICIDEGLYGEAEQALRKLERDSELPAALALRASYAFEEQAVYKVYARHLQEYYISIYPYDEKVRRRLAEGYVLAGEDERALAHLQRLHSYGSATRILAVAKIYDTTLQRPDQALRYYERYLQLNPRDHKVNSRLLLLRKEVAANLARDRLTAKELWLQAGSLSSQPVLLVVDAIQFLLASGTMKELAANYMQLLPAPKTAGKKLLYGELYSGLGQWQQLLQLLDSVAVADRSNQYYRLRIVGEEAQGFEYAAYRSRYKLSQIEPKERQLSLLEGAAVYGELDDIKELLTDKNIYHKFLKNSRIQHLVAYAYGEAGLFSKGEEYLQAAEQNDIESVLAWIQFYRQRGWFHEAETVARHGLVTYGMNSTILQELATLAIADERISDARYWYALAQQHVGKQPSLQHRQRLLLISLFWAEGKYEKAEEKLRFWLAKGSLTAGRERDLHDALCLSMEYQGKGALCSRRQEKKLSACVAYQLQEGFPPQIQEVLCVAKALFRAKNFEKSLNYWQHLQKLIGESDEGIRYQAECYAILGNYQRAQELYQVLADKYPKEWFYTVRLAEIAEHLAIDPAAELSQQQLPDYGEGEGALPGLSLIARRTEWQLLQARVLWLRGDRVEALALYRKIEKLLQSQLVEVEGIEYSGKKGGYWQDMVELFYQQSQPYAALMTPLYLVEHIKDPEGEMVARLYASSVRYRNVSQEYEARNAIYQQKLLLAERNFRKFLESEQNDEFLLDLARIYDRLGEHSRAVQIYQHLQATGTAISPDVTALLEENLQQRRPQLMAEVGYQNREGRDGAVDIELFRSTLRNQFFPTAQYSFSFEYAATRYNGDGDALWDHTFLAGFDFDREEAFSLGGKLGADFLEGAAGAEFVGEFELKYRLLPQLRSYLGVHRYKIDDTLASVAAEIYATDTAGGLVLETPLGFDLGADYTYIWVEDGNRQTKFTPWLAYTLFTTSREWSMRYDFLYFDGSDLGAEPIYWSPDGYTLHNFSLALKQNFSISSSEKERQSHYSLACSVGVEDDQNIIYSSKFDIFLEMSTHFLLNGTFQYTTSDEYDESVAQIGLSYRW